MLVQVTLLTAAIVSQTAAGVFLIAPVLVAEGSGCPSMQYRFDEAVKRGKLDGMDSAAQFADFMKNECSPARNKKNATTLAAARAAAAQAATTSASDGALDVSNNVSRVLADANEARAIDLVTDTVRRSERVGYMIGLKGGRRVDAVRFGACVWGAAHFLSARPKCIQTGPKGKMADPECIASAHAIPHGSDVAELADAATALQMELATVIHSKPEFAGAPASVDQLSDDYCGFTLPEAVVAFRTEDPGLTEVWRQVTAEKLVAEALAEKGALEQGQRVRAAVDAAMASPAYRQLVIASDICGKHNQLKTIEKLMERQLEIDARSGTTDRAERRRLATAQLNLEEGIEKLVKEYVKAGGKPVKTPAQYCALPKPNTMIDQARRAASQ